VGPAFFKGTEHSITASKYYNILIGGNFFFPLGAVLSSFFLAQGKRWVVVWSALGAYGINFLLDIVLIFGIPAILLPIGALGAAWSTLSSKFTFCLILFLCFISRFNRDCYYTHCWKISFASIFRLIRICGPRSAGKAFAILIWTATTCLMIAKGGDYLSILSIGSTLTLFCSFLSESLIQALSVMMAHYMGSKNYTRLWKSLWYGIFFSLLATGCLAIPFLLFPDYILSFFFSLPPEGATSQFLKSTITWVWFWVFFNGLNAPLLACLLAARDTIYYMIVMSLTWITSWLPIYYCLYRLEWSPDKFWFILIFDQLIVLLLNTCRVYFISKSYRKNLYPKHTGQNLQTKLL
jgi:Na+-driven multidrug efflux pump